MERVNDLIKLDTTVDKSKGFIITINTENELKIKPYKHITLDVINKPIDKNE